MTIYTHRADPTQGAILVPGGWTCVTLRDGVVTGGTDALLSGLPPHGTYAPPALDFGDALAALKAGKRVRRAGWNGKGMWLALTEGSKVDTRSAPLRGALVHYAVEAATGAVGLLCGIGAHIDMRAANGDIVIGWTPNTLDVLAEDWEVVE